MVNERAYIPVITVDSDQDTKRATAFWWRCALAGGAVFGISVVFAQMMDSWTPVIIGAAIAVLLIAAGIAATWYLLTFGIRTEADIVKSQIDNAHDLATIEARRAARISVIEAQTRRDLLASSTAAELARIAAPADTVATRNFAGSTQGKAWPWQDREARAQLTQPNTAVPYLKRTVAGPDGAPVRLAIVDAIVAVWQRDERAAGLSAAGPAADPFGNRKPYSRKRVSEFMRTTMSAEGDAFRNEEYGAAEQALLAYAPADAAAARWAFTKIKHGIAPDAPPSLSAGMSAEMPRGPGAGDRGPGDQAGTASAPPGEFAPAGEVYTKA